MNNAITPETAALKRWTTIRAQACRAGISTWRSDPTDGPVQFFSMRFGVARLHANLDALADYVAGVEAIAA